MTDHYTDLDLDVKPEGTVVRRDMTLLCTIRQGWRARFFGKWLLLTHPDHQPQTIHTGSILDGDVLPREP